MPISKEQAIANLTHFYQTRLPSELGKQNLSAAVEAIETNASMATLVGEELAAKWVEESYIRSFDSFILRAKVDLGAFPSTQYGDDVSKFAEDARPDELVDFLHPNASSADKAALVKAITSGTISNEDLIYGWLEETRENPNPSSEDLFETIHEAGRGNLDLGPPSDLPDSTLHFDGISNGQLEFLIAVYVGAFGRAPVSSPLE